ADVSGRAAFGARDALVLSVYRHLLELAVVLVPSDLAGQEAGPAGGVHPRGPARGLLGTVGPRVAERDSVTFEDGVDRPIAFPHVDAAPLRVTEEQLVEAGARHLVSLRHRRLHRRGEVDGGGGAAVELREAG